MFEFSKESDQMIAYYKLNKHKNGKSLKQLSMELGMQPNLTFDDLKGMSVDALAKLPREVLLSLSDDDMKYVSDTLKNSMSEAEWMAAVKRLDTGIYDEQGNLIGDRFDEDDAYEWDG